MSPEITALMARLESGATGPPNDLLLPQDAAEALRELSKDAERLDALEQNWAKWGVDSYAKDPSKFGLWFEGDTTDGNEYSSLRAAIDAAKANQS